MGLFSRKDRKARKGDEPQGLSLPAGLPADAVEQVMAKAGCPREDALARIAAASECGADFDWFLETGLFALSAREIKRYLDREVPRSFVEELSRYHGLPEYEVYSQMRKAKDAFGITYTFFSIHDLVGLDDAQLEERRRSRQQSDEDNIAKIAAITGETPDDVRAKAERIREKHKVTLEDYRRHALYAMSEDDIAAAVSDMKREREERIQSVMDATGWSKGKVRAEMNRCLRQFGIDRSFYHALRCYGLPDEKLGKFATLRDSKSLSAKYNGENRDILDRKDLFASTFREYMGRGCWISQGSSFEEFEEFAKGKDAVFCKPVNASHGIGAKRLKIAGRNLRDLYEQLSDGPLCVVEELIEQHPEMAEFNESSINTVRLFTLLDNGEFHPFNAYVRFGVGDVVDNYSAGGLECGVDPSTGVIVTPAIHRSGRTYESHPVSGKEFVGFQIPHWDKVLETAESALRGVDGVGYVGWDIAVRPDDVVLVEGNAQPGMGVYQRFLIERDESLRPAYERFLS